MIEIHGMIHWDCPICEERFDDADDASIHWNNAHRDEIEEAWKSHEHQNDLDDK